MTGELDALAIRQALADMGPGWCEPTGTPSALVCRNRDGSTVLVTAARDWTCATVTTGPLTAQDVIEAVAGAVWDGGGTYTIFPAACRRTTCPRAHRHVIHALGRAG